MFRSSHSERGRGEAIPYQATWEVAHARDEIGLLRIARPQQRLENHLVDRKNLLSGAAGVIEIEPHRPRLIGCAERGRGKEQAGEKREHESAEEQRGGAQNRGVERRIGLLDWQLDKDQPVERGHSCTRAQHLSALDVLGRLLLRRHESFAVGTFRELGGTNPSVLGYTREHENDVVLCVNNLSRFPQPIELNLNRWSGYRPMELTGRVPFPRIGQLPYLLTLPGHGFYWFQLVEPEDD